MTFVFLHPFHICGMIMKRKKKSQQIPKHCPGVQWGVMDSGQIWSLLWGPSRWIHSLIAHCSGEQHKKSSWKKIGVSLASLGGFAGILCCLVHSWRCGRRWSIPWFYISEDGRLGWNSGLRTRLVIQSQHHQFPHLSCKFNYLLLFSLQSLLDRWPQLPAKLHCWNRKPPTGWVVFAGNQHIFLRVLPSKPIQTDNICSVKEIFFFVYIHSQPKGRLSIRIFLFLWRHA